MMRTHDGRTLFLSVTGAPSYTDTGEIGAAVLVCRDVTERWRMEDALRQSEERFRTAFTSIRVGIALADLQLRFLQVNAAYCAIIGYSEEELLNTDFISITHPDDREDNIASIQKLVAGKVPDYVLQKRYIRKDGSSVWVQNTVSLIRDSEGRPASLIAVTEDITERHEWTLRTQNALETLLVMAEMLVSVPSTPDLPTIDPPTTHSEEHGEIRHLVQLTCDLLGSKIANISTLEPETLRLLPLVRVGVAPESELVWREQLPKTVLSDYLFPADIARLQAGEALLVDMKHPVVPGTPNYDTQQVLSAPLRIGEQLVGLLSTNYDTSTHIYSLEEEKVLLRAIGKLIALMIERERLVQERADGLARELTLREVNRQTDEFIGIISHELKSPLTTIKGNVQLARRQMNRVLAQQSSLSKELADPLEQILHFLERAERNILVQTRLINDLLDVSRIHSNRLELHIERRDLVPIVREAVEDQRQIAPTRTIQLSLEEPQALIMIDADRVGQVLNNYLSNALKYSDVDKPIGIRLSRTENQVKVAVTDQGPGLSPTQQEHIWERFYRVPKIEVKSGSGIGLGLGLHICRTIIERQGGSIGVESEPGKGSTFWFALPL
jgi:PAS domain S-box-containing protein